MLIRYIEARQNKTKDKASYEKLIYTLFQPLEKAIEDFYNDEFEKINNDKICLFYDKYFKKHKNRQPFHDK